MRIPFTKPFLPSRGRYGQMVDGIWESRWLTNNGRYLQKFEHELNAFLGAGNTSVVTSGTSALQLALKTLEPGGQVITTPYSYVATTSTIVWEGFEPVFADIEKDGFCIDPIEVEKKITSKTKAVLATHVYGNPCHVEELERICSKQGIPLIFDGAHAFGSGYRGRSLLTYGDISILSFHATKLFHSVNGGAVFCRKPEIKERIDRLRNFGHTGVNEFDGIGINSKMCEFHSAMGLLNLEMANELVSQRRAQWDFYGQLIGSGDLKTLSLRDKDGFNGAYFPVVFPNTSLLQKAIDSASEKGIELRRYFSPALNKLNYVTDQPCPVAEDLSRRTCCLPMYHDLGRSGQEEVTELILSV